MDMDSFLHAPPLPNSVSCSATASCDRHHSSPTSHDKASCGVVRAARGAEKADWAASLWRREKHSQGLCILQMAILRSAIGCVVGNPAIRYVGVRSSRRQLVGLLSVY